MEGDRPTTSAGPPGEVRFSDLGVVVHTDGVPRQLPGELPPLYSCLFSTLDYLVAYQRTVPDGACVLTDPRHVLLLRHEGAEIDVLNRGCAIGREEVHRACRALFRAYRGVDRVRLDIMFPPDQLSFPWTPVKEESYLVIDLPATVDEYYHSLGKSTRKTLRGYRNRLAREFPDMRTETVDGRAADRALVDRLVEWKVRRFRRDGRTTYWETSPQLVGRTAELLRRCGWGRVTYISGREAAIHVCFRTGDTVLALEGACDPAYEAYRLNLLTMYDTVCAAIESGAARFNAMSGATGPKEALGAHPVPSTRVTVYRSWVGMRLHVLARRARRRARGVALAALARGRSREAAH